jgi:hypothetical protein
MSSFAPGSDRHSDAAAPRPRDPFADDVLERLIRSNQDYQRHHGNYIVPLSERLLAARAALRDAQRIIVDYSEGRVDSLVALGKIGLRLQEVDPDA